ncbi:hypothetical protein STA1M1_09560 [Sinisalibacter aestuarii]|uniref:Uncharacterized protein n=1 Tax=Sinisalibacter aestuarii TaxID=2949426 RepID=A0ABQ5LQ09_9RHOB|nr:hypothetical protein STA1M1_09560 [Sinisalibacter aestuarii]
MHPVADRLCRSDCGAGSHRADSLRARGSDGVRHLSRCLGALAGKGGKAHGGQSGKVRKESAPRCGVIFH